MRATSEDSGARRVNREIAEALRQAADLLEEQQANPFRVGAYRKAAQQIVLLEKSLADIYEAGGRDALVALPGVGRGIASAIVEYLASGRWTLLDRLRGRADPEALFRTVPGIGPRLAETIHDTLHVDTLSALREAGHAGRLEMVPGVGPRRAASLVAALDSMRIGPIRRAEAARSGPAAAVLLEIDADYRRQCAAGTLPLITPQRFNPSGTLRIPVLHTRRGEWHFTVLFSNTARAHRLGRTRDWVVIYYYDRHHREGQHTVVTETGGPLAGRRVVRGLEEQSARHYRRFGSFAGEGYNDGGDSR